MRTKYHRICVSSPNLIATIRSNSLKLLSFCFVYARAVGFFAVLAFLGSIRPAMGAQNSAGGAATFKTHCAACHGPDGSGNTTVGKSMNIPDLHSAEIQKLSDAEISAVISNGKNGMPPFKNLSKDQIHSLIALIRELAAKK